VWNASDLVFAHVSYCSCKTILGLKCHCTIARPVLGKAFSNVQLCCEGHAVQGLCRSVEDRLAQCLAQTVTSAADLPCISRGFTSICELPRHSQRNLTDVTIALSAHT